MYTLAFKDLQGWPTLLKDKDGRMYAYSTKEVADEALDSLRNEIRDVLETPQTRRVPIFFGILTKEVEDVMDFDNSYLLDRIRGTLYVHNYQTSMYHMNHQELKLC